MEIERIDKDEMDKEQLEIYNDLSDYDKRRADYHYENNGDVDDALENYENVEYYEDMTLDDLAVEFYDEGLVSDEQKESYFDYDKFAHDLSFDYDEQDDGVYRLD